MFTVFALAGINPDAIAQAGLWLIALIIFAESGLLVGFFLPGDTLLIAAGVLASAGSMNLLPTIIVIALAAIIGDSVGYGIGKYSGPKLFKQKDGVLFRQEYVTRAQDFYTKHGGKTIVLARFTPIVRTFAPMVAGMSKMPYGRFLAFNIFGGIVWASALTLIGFWLGSKIPRIGDYLEYAIIFVILATLIPAAWHVVSNKKSRALMSAKFKNLFHRTSAAEVEDSQD